MAPTLTPTGTIKTWDGVSIAYNQAGPEGAPNLLLLSGWSQTAAQWQKQVEFFSRDFRVTAYDCRGHGESGNINRGFRISRFSADLNDLVTQLDLQDIVMVGHSMGCSVIWSYWYLFADSRSRIKKLVIVDQSPCMIAYPSWTAEEARSLAAVFAPTESFETAAAIRGPERAAFVSALLRSMFTEDVSDLDLEWVIKQNMKMDPVSASLLFLDHSKIDWRDVTPTISVPTLVIGATGSVCPFEGLEWIASQIPGARFHVFKKEDGGSHFVFWDNPVGFNKLVQRFIQS